MSSRNQSGDDQRARFGAVLAGGRSARMGTAKASIPLCGRPLVSYPVEAMAAAGLEPVIVAKRDSTLPDLECRVVRESDSRPHPAAGILAALQAAEGPVVVVACDMPFVPAQLLTVLAQFSAPAALPALAGHLQPLLARYEPSVAPALERAVERDEPLRDAVRALDPLVLGPEELAGFGAPDLIAINVNDPAGLEEAERLMTPAPGR